MFIQTEETPNPATLKFLPGRLVLAAGSTANFTTAEAAVRSPLAVKLFEVEGVTGVFLGSDFITVTKSEDKEWYLLKPAILGVIMDHFTSGQPTLADGDARRPRPMPRPRLIVKLWCRLRNCWILGCVLRWLKMAGILPSRDITKVWFIFICKDHAPAVQAQRRR